ncbi:hypothetical protein DPEC_G00371140, partial [Dallia pectoralis]
VFSTQAEALCAGLSACPVMAAKILSERQRPGRPHLWHQCGHHAPASGFGLCPPGWHTPSVWPVHILLPYTGLLLLWDIQTHLHRPICCDQSHGWHGDTNTGPKQQLHDTKWNQWICSYRYGSP